MPSLESHMLQGLQLLGPNQPSDDVKQGTQEVKREALGGLFAQGKNLPDIRRQDKIAEPPFSKL